MLSHPSHKIEVEQLYRLEMIRSQASKLFLMAERGDAVHFTYHPENTYYVVQYVQELIEQHYPDLNIPSHSRLNHFQVGTRNKFSEHFESNETANLKEQFECLVLSVLLDAGAGGAWRYTDPETNLVLTRSEGLAIATFNAFKKGIFSNKDKQVTADSLATIDKKTFAAVFECSDANPLAGLTQRLNLIHRLSELLAANEDYFGPEHRLGNFIDKLNEDIIQQHLCAEKIFNHLMGAFSKLWNYGAVLNKRPLGDVWHYPRLGETFESNLVPFHKLTQWLCYSVVDLYEKQNIQIDNIDRLTGLAEYRNGGLLVDAGILQLKKANNMAVKHAVNSDLIIEWRALTIIILDEIQLALNKMMHTQLTLPQVLEAGTWQAGRQMARIKRQSNEPPICIRADGITF